MNLTSEKVKVKMFGPNDVVKITHAAGASMQDVYIEKNGSRVDAKSILGVFTLGLRDGDEVTIISEDAATVQVICDAARASY